MDSETRQSPDRDDNGSADQGLPVADVPTQDASVGAQGAIQSDPERGEVVARPRGEGMATPRGRIPVHFRLPRIANDNFSLKSVKSQLLDSPTPPGGRTVTAIAMMEGIIMASHDPLRYLMFLETNNDPGPIQDGDLKEYLKVRYFTAFWGRGNVQLKKMLEEIPDPEVRQETARGINKVLTDLKPFIEYWRTP